MLNLDPFLTDDRTRMVYIGPVDPYTGKRNRFHLAGSQMGREGVLLGTDPTGLEFPPIELLWSEGAREMGSTYLDTVNTRREVDIQAQISGRSIRDFRQKNDVWWKSWSTRKEGHLCVYTRFNGWRWLAVRLGGAPEPLFNKDPALIRAGDYDMTIVAGDPLWNTFREKFLWKNTSLAGAGYIKIRNASPHEIRPKFYMPGPGIYSIQDGVDGPMIEMPLLEAGETLSIDTHGQRPTVRISSLTKPNDTLTGMKLLKGKRFRNPIQPWNTSTIKVAVDGGNAQSQVYSIAGPRFDRPW